MITNLAQSIYQQLRKRMGVEIEFNEVVIIRCTKASWEYDMDIYMLGQKYPFYQDATLLIVRDLLADESHGVKIVLLCDCALENLSCNQVQGFLDDKRKAALLHGMKCFLMLVRDKLILSRFLKDSACFLLATIDGDEIEFHSEKKELILDFVRNLIE